MLLTGFLLSSKLLVVVFFDHTQPVFDNRDDNFIRQAHTLALDLVAGNASVLVQLRLDAEREKLFLLCFMCHMSPARFELATSAV